MDARFHNLQAAFASDDLDRVKALLTSEPELATARSQTSHPTILQCLVLTMPPGDKLEGMIEVLASCGAELSGPLIAASGMDNMRAVAKLLDLGADINGQGRWSPLEEALYWKRRDATNLLLERGVPIRNLRSAAALGDLDKVRGCFDERGRLNPEAGEVSWPFGDNIPILSRRDPKQILDNALVYAAIWDQRSIVDFLLDRGAEINAIPLGFDYAGTALHYAAFHGHGDLVEHLLQRDARADIVDAKIGVRPEEWAEHMGHKELADRLRHARQG